MMTTIAVLLILAAPVRAAEASKAPEDQPWLLTGEYLYYLPSSAGQGVREQLQNQANILLAQGYQSASYSTTRSGGSGARGGAMYKWDRRTWLGGCFDYVLGPSSHATFTAVNGTGQIGTMTVDRSVSFLRLMGRTWISLWSRGPWDVDFDSALGIGLGDVPQNCQASGAVTCSLGNSERDWVGFAWEFGAKASRRFQWFDLHAGVRYAGFPPFSGTSAIARIQWQPWGVYAGASF